MEAMKPMKPMEPMAPMKPMAKPDSSWWPSGLSSPSSSGGQGSMRYAFFPNERRLVVDQNGHVTQYDTAEHQISGVSQAQGGSDSALSFSSQSGDVKLASLKKVG